MNAAAGKTPRQHVHLPGYTFDGHSTLHFGSLGAVAVDLYRKRGGITAEVRNMIRNQSAANPDEVEKWGCMYWRDHGDSIVAIRVRAAS